MTRSVRSLIAALPDAAQLPNSLAPGAQHSLRGILPIALAVTAVLFGLLIWAVFVRKSPRYRQKGALLEGATEAHTEGRRRRRRRREHRARNPTRAETGGLPPPGAGASDPPSL